jgi:hypothetical protein
MAITTHRSTKQAIDSAAASAFFDWLVPLLPRIFDDTDAQEEVSRKLTRLSAGLRWEAGPWEDGVSFFAVSPGLDVELVAVSKAVTQLAPKVPGWVFMSAKPRKRWDKTVRFASSNGVQMAVDLSTWKYYLTSFNDAEFLDVNLVPSDETYSEVELSWLGEMLVASELGEAIFLSYVGKVNVVQRANLTNAVDPIEHLHDHLMQQVAARRRH